MKKDKDKTRDQALTETEAKYPITGAILRKMDGRDREAIKAAGFAHHTSALCEMADDLYTRMTENVGEILTEDERRALRPWNVADLILGMLRNRAEAGKLTEGDAAATREAEAMAAEAEERRNKRAEDLLDSLVEHLRTAAAKAGYKSRVITGSKAETLGDKLN